MVGQRKQFNTLSFVACAAAILHILIMIYRDYYISQVVSKFLKMVDEGDSHLQAWDVSSAERRYVAEALRKVKVTFIFNELPAAIPLVSNKFNKTIETLLRQPPGFAGIVFVKERATVAAIAHLLSVRKYRSCPLPLITTSVGNVPGDKSTHNLLLTHPFLESSRKKYL